MYVVIFFDYENLLLYILLWSMSLFKEYLIQNTNLKTKYPGLYSISLIILSIINTCIIIYFLNNIYVELIAPFIRKLFNVLKMASSSNNNNNNSNSSGGTPGNTPNEPKKPETEFFLRKNNTVGTRKKKNSSSKQIELEKEIGNMDLTEQEKKYIQDIKINE